MWSLVQNKKEDRLLNIFPFMDEINYSTYEEFIHTVKKKRNEMLIPDKKYISMESVHIDLSKIRELPVGKFHTVFQGIHLDCLAFVKEESPLYIMLSGDVGTLKKSEPGFYRWSYYKYCSGSVLCIADPMISIYDNLRLGWYYGNSAVNFRKLIAEFVKVVADFLRVEHEDIIFFGSSAGGAPTFECASYISGAKAVAINPQIVLEEYYYAQEFSKITGNDLNRTLLDYRNNALHYIKNRERNPYIIIVNIHSENDMKQINNIKNSLQIDIQYGLNVYDNLVIWLYDAEVAPVFNPHSACEYYCVWFFIEYIIRNINNKERGVFSDQESLYRLVNEFWHEHWAMRKQRVEMTRLWAEILNMLHKSGRKAAVFGCGEKSKKVWNDLLDIQGINYFNIEFGIDNDRRKTGTEVMGLRVKHPSEIMDWHNLYVIITSNLYSEEIYEQLEDYGLTYKEDFILYTDLDF